MAKIFPKELRKVIRLKDSGRALLQQLIAKNLGIKIASDGRQISANPNRVEELDFKLNLYEEELKRIPKEGGLVLIMNNPLPSLDFLLVYKALEKHRPDLKVVLNKDFRHNLISHLEAEPKLEYLAPQDFIDAPAEDGQAYLVCPAEGRLLFNLNRRRFEDGVWSQDLMQAIQQRASAVVPLYLKVDRSVSLGLLNKLQALKPLPQQPEDQKNQRLLLRIGRCIYPREQEGYRKTDRFTSHLRQRIYILGETLHHRYSILNLKRPQQAEPIAPKQNQEQQIREFKNLERLGKVLVSQKNYRVALAKSDEIPAILLEIGRLRELNFRAIGEGSNKALDLDRYDYHYQHLILWDAEQNALAGAYRLGIGPEIYELYGIRGFYLFSLFKVKKKARPIIAQSLDMGRAFIDAEHQQKPLPLFLLWNGIKEVMRLYPGLKYIVGCASISNSFSAYSKNLMAAYLLKNFGDAFLAESIKPRKKFKVKLNRAARSYILESSAQDLNHFDRKIDEIEPGPLRFPVLIKKYLQQKALIVCFNVDPLFNNSIDGFMYLKREHLELWFYKLEHPLRLDPCLNAGPGRFI